MERQRDRTASLGGLAPGLGLRARISERVLVAITHHGRDPEDGSSPWSHTVEAVGPSSAWSSIALAEGKMFAVFGEIVTNARMMAFTLE